MVNRIIEAIKSFFRWLFGTREVSNLTVAEPEEKREPIDLTRLPRGARRELGKKLHGKIIGRNLPYVKESYGNLPAFLRIRQEEIEAEKRLRPQSVFPNGGAG